MNIIDLLTQGKIHEFKEIPERLDTTVSHIFIFKNARKVLKIYRRDNEYWNSNFGDLSGGKKRINFIKEDYAANFLVNPSVYIHLKTAVIDDNKVRLINANNHSDELVIMMNKVETSESFIDTLFKKHILENEFTSIGEQFARIKQAIHIAEFKPKDDWYEIIVNRLRDLQLWMENLNFPKQDIAACLQKLKSYADNHKKRLSEITGNKIVYSIDGHGENALYYSNKLQFIDILWPNPRWRWTAKEYDIFRLGADIFALNGEKHFNSFIRGVKNIYPNLDETDKDFYLLYNAALDNCVLKTLITSKPQKAEQQKKYYSWFISRLEIFDSR